jgi:type II secretory pathway pseudopilin PulG
MLVTMIIISSLLAGAAVLVSMQLASNRSSDVTRTGLAATYCAEAGLSAVRQAVATNYADWQNQLAACNGVYPCAEPAWIAAVNHDIDSPADGVGDFLVYIKDNDDEVAPAVNDPRHDSDQRVFIVSRCTKYADTTKEVEELVEYTGGGQNYRSQQGLGRYSGGNNN